MKIVGEINAFEKTAVPGAGVSVDERLGAAHRVAIPPAHRVDISVVAAEPRCAVRIRLFQILKHTFRLVDSAALKILGVFFNFGNKRLILKRELHELVTVPTPRRFIGLVIKLIDTLYDRIEIFGLAGHRGEIESRSKHKARRIILVLLEYDVDGVFRNPLVADKTLHLLFDRRMGFSPAPGALGPLKKFFGYLFLSGGAIRTGDKSDRAGKIVARIVSRHRDEINMVRAVALRPVVFAAGVTGSLNPRSDSAVGLLGLYQMTHAPKRLVENIGNSIAGFRNRKLTVEKFIGIKQVHQRQSARNYQVHGTAVVVRRIMITSGQMQNLVGIAQSHAGFDRRKMLELVRLSVLGNDGLAVRRKHRRTIRPFIRGMNAAIHVHVTGIRRPLGPWRALFYSAAFVKEALHMNTPGLDYRLV